MEVQILILMYGKQVMTENKEFILKVVVELFFKDMDILLLLIMLLNFGLLVLQQNLQLMIMAMLILQIKYQLNFLLLQILIEIY